MDTQFKYCGGHTYYYENDVGGRENCENTDILDDDEYCHTAGLTCEFTIPAPLTDELLSVLPQSDTRLVKHKGQYYGEYRHPDSVLSIPDWRVSAPTPADACALLVLELKERKIV